MDTVTVSPKYQVVIPLKARQALGIKAGQKVRVLVYHNRLELIPVTPIRQARGFLRDLETSLERDDDRV